MTTKSGLYIVDPAKAADVIAESEGKDWRIFQLPDDIATRDNFFDGVRRTLPLDPPLESNYSWDALDDSVWSGLHALPEKNIMIVWPNAVMMQTHAYEASTIAEFIFKAMAETLANAKSTVGMPKHLIILLVN